LVCSLVSTREREKKETGKSDFSGHNLPTEEKGFTRCLVRKKKFSTFFSTQRKRRTFRIPHEGRENTSENGKKKI